MITTAEESMREDLVELCSRCFGDSTEYTRMMFRHIFAPQHVLVFLSENKPVSMLFFLPCALTGEGESIPCHYIYAACTHEEYRGRGLMSLLLEEAARLGGARGQKFSILVPAGESLFDYYGQRGYRTEFFRLHTQLTAGEIESLDVAPAEIFPVDAAKMAAMRRKMWGDDPLTLIRDQKSMAFTLADADYYGDRVVGLGSGGEEGYALCGSREDGVLIKELCCTPQLAYSALKAVHAFYNSHRYTVITPPYFSLGTGDEKKVPYGMARNLTDGSPGLSMAEWAGLKKGAAPYINLMFD